MVKSFSENLQPRQPCCQARRDQPLAGGAKRIGEQWRNDDGGGGGTAKFQRFVNTMNEPLKTSSSNHYLYCFEKKCKNF